MTGPRIEDATGRAKEAVGALTGNDDLKAEGQEAAMALDALVGLVERDFDEDAHAQSA